jgi:superfamily II DNA helicase RecQ
MGRKRHRRIIPKNILEGHLEKPDEKELEVILMGADSIIPISGGRNYLTQLLKGSKSQVMKRNNAEESEHYGKLSNLTLKEIERRIDWMIVKEWLKLEQEWRQPHIRHTNKGWQRAKKLWVDKLIKLMENDIDAFLLKIRDIHHEIKYQILDRVQEKELTSLTPLLLRWKEIGVRKVRKRINAILRNWT